MGKHKHTALPENKHRVFLSAHQKVPQQSLIDHNRRKSSSSSHSIFEPLEHRTSECLLIRGSQTIIFTTKANFRCSWTLISTIVERGFSSAESDEDSPRVSRVRSISGSRVFLSWIGVEEGARHQGRLPGRGCF